MGYLQRNAMNYIFVFSGVWDYLNDDVKISRKLVDKAITIHTFKGSTFVILFF